MYDLNLEENGDALAARYALGVASAAEIAVAENRLATDDAFIECVASYDALFSELDNETTGTPLPKGLWSRIDASVGDFEKSPFTRTVRPAVQAWEPFAPGIKRKLVHTDGKAGAQIVLYKVEPGTQFASHGHLIAEECLVLEGEIEIDGITVLAGDVHIAFAHTRHGVLTSRTGALLYVRGDLQIQP